MQDDIGDLFIIGGGVNGCGIARDAAGRGLSVTLVEMGDLASATSSASTKLFHGGLRYLEYFELGLVRESLIERERLLRASPHISWPMRFVLPYRKDMTFEGGTPATRLVNAVMPWARGRRPAWMIRFGLMLYDRLGGRGLLPGTRRLDLTTDPAGGPLKPAFRTAFEYSDCWVDDARLVVLTARDAKARGARILTRHRAVRADRLVDHWRIEVAGPDGAITQYRARALVNAAGPWVGDTLEQIAGTTGRATVRLVRGSHIVTRRLYDHDRCYFLQGRDGRIVFAIPYEQDFTLIGTTDVDHPDPDVEPECTQEEEDYLIGFVSDYLDRPVTAGDIVWRYSGVRPLYDDGASSAAAATRDYVLSLDRTGGAPILSVFGGKITTYRRLSEEAVDQIGTALPLPRPAWTEGAPLPGGDFPVAEVAERVADLRAAYPFLDASWALRLFRAYGTEAQDMLGGARAATDLGQDFGGTLTERELRWMMTHEFARTTEDVIWRRSKLGLRLDALQVQRLADWMQAQDAV